MGAGMGADLLLFAQQVADPMNGWGALILQGGAFGLLAYIVIYLAPAVLKESREERERRDAAFTTLVNALQERFEVRNQMLVAAIEKQTAAINQTFQGGLTRIESAVAAACKHKP